MPLLLEIPDDFASAVAPTAESARCSLDLEIALYLRGVVVADRAAEVAGVPRAIFEQALSLSAVERNYSASGLTSSLEWAVAGR